MGNAQRRREAEEAAQAAVAVKAVEAVVILTERQPDPIPVTEPSQQPQEVPIIEGEPKLGPKAMHGKDAVPAKLSFFDVGIKHASQCAAHDERMFGLQGTIRTQLSAILDAPQDAWFSYPDGFKQVLDQRKEKNQPTAALGVLRSQITRVLNAGKRNHTDVKAKLADTKLRWNIMLKSLPKVHEAKGAPTQEKTEEQSAIAVETNVGTLVQVIYAAAKRLEALGKAHTPYPAYFAWYMGKELQEYAKIASDFAIKTVTENTVGGIIQHEAVMDALSLKPKAAPEPVAVAVAVHNSNVMSS